MLRVFPFAFVAALSAACATTEVVAPDDQAATTGDDVPVVATPRAFWLSQVDDREGIDPALSLGCSGADGTLENSWYRVFSFEQTKVRGPSFAVNRVNFAVGSATAPRRVQVWIGTYGGTFGDPALDPAQIEMQAMTTVDVPATDTGTLAQANFAAFPVATKQLLIVEVRADAAPAVTFSRDGSGGSRFYLGASPGPESTAGYFRAPACGYPNPEMTSAVGHLGSHLIISVAGTN